MRLEQLYYLVEIAKANSITLAAERIYVTQQSISEAIQKFEKELGVTLLNRSRQGVYLTEAGKEVVTKARIILKNIEELKSQFSAKPELSGSLAIYAVPIISTFMLHGVLATFHKSHPKVHIVLKEIGTTELLQNIGAGEGDLGLVLIPDEFLESDKMATYEIHFQKLFSNKLFACVGKSSPLSSKWCISIAELLKFPLVLYEEKSFNRAILEKFGKLNIFMITNSMEALRKTITNGLAVGFVDGIFFKESLYFNKEELTIISIKEDIKVSFGWIKSKNRQLSVVAKEFLKTLKNQY